jgi:hypothetical protein
MGTLMLTMVLAAGAADGVDVQEVPRPRLRASIERVASELARPAPILARGVGRASPEVRASGRVVTADAGAFASGARRLEANAGAVRQARPVKRRSVTRIVLGAAVGATGGFFGGGFLGAAIEGDRCNCDDPGLQGFLIGAPVGAVAGGILGGKFLF